MENGNRLDDSLLKQEVTFGLRRFPNTQKRSQKSSPPVKVCEEKKKASTGMKLCKGLKEENKEAALSAQLAHGQKKKTLTNCSQEETLASEMGTAGCKGTLKFVTQFSCRDIYRRYFQTDLPLCSPHNQLWPLQGEYCSHAQQLSQSQNCPLA